VGPAADKWTSNKSVAQILDRESGIVLLPPFTDVSAGWGRAATPRAALCGGRHRAPPPCGVGGVGVGVARSTGRPVTGRPVAPSTVDGARVRRRRQRAGASARARCGTTLLRGRAEAAPRGRRSQTRRQRRWDARAVRWHPHCGGGRSCTSCQSTGTPKGKKKRNPTHRHNTSTRTYAAVRPTWRTTTQPRGAASAPRPTASVGSAMPLALGGVARPHRSAGRCRL